MATPNDQRLVPLRLDAMGDRCFRSSFGTITETSCGLRNVGLNSIEVVLKGMDEVYPRSVRAGLPGEKGMILVDGSTGLRETDDKPARCYPGWAKLNMRDVITKPLDGLDRAKHPILVAVDLCAGGKFGWGLLQPFPQRAVFSNPNEDFGARRHFL